jgi:hypothetical protein
VSIYDTRLVAAPINLNHPGHYLHWGVIQLSVANLVVIAVMVAVFVLAILAPFPKDRDRR